MFATVVSYMAEKIPTNPDPYLLLRSNIKLGSLLLSSAQYRQSLYMVTSKGKKKDPETADGVDWM